MNEQGGSFAKATALGERLDNRVHWILQRLDATINEQLIKVAVRIRFGPQDAYPEVHGLTDEVEDAGTIATAFKDVTEAIGKVLPVREGELRSRLGYAEPEAGDRLVGGDQWTAEGKPEREDLDAEQNIVVGPEREDMTEANLTGDGDGDGDGE